MLYPKHYVELSMTPHIEDQYRKDEVHNIAKLMTKGIAESSSNLAFLNVYPGVRKLLQFFEHLQHHHGSSNNSRFFKLSKIFGPYQKKDGSSFIPNMIIIEGAPGMGKTTLCKEIAYQWASNQILTDHEVVLFISLCNPAVQLIKDVRGLIQHFYSLDVEILEHYLIENSKKVAIIFDGYDEFCDSGENSIITKILNRKILTECKIIITSRHTASYKLLNQDKTDAYVRVEILGFTKESREQYIQQELNDFSKVRKIQSYLDSHPSIETMCCIPMMMTILVYVFKEKEREKKDLPANLTNLYETLVACTICRFYQKLKSVKSFMTIHDMPEECKTYLSNLSKFAFLTLEKHQIVFTEEDIKSLCPDSPLTLSRLDGLGLVKITHYFSIELPDKQEVSGKHKPPNKRVYNFLNLSVQEYLAAYFLGSIDQSRQFERLKDTFFSSQYNHMWKMFIAMNKHKWITFKHYSLYFKGIDGTKVEKWISDNDKINLFDSFIDFSKFICQKGDNIQLFCFKANKETKKDFFGLYCEQKLYLALNSDDTAKTNLFEIFIFGHDIYMEWLRIADALVNFHNIAVTVVSNFSLQSCKAKQNNLISSLKMNNSLPIIALKDCCITDKAVKSVTDCCLKSEYLEHVFFSNCSFDKNGLREIINALSNKLSLSSIIIADTIVDEGAVKPLASTIRNNANLQILQLNNISLQAGIEKIIYAIENITTLKALSITHNTISPAVSDRLATALQSNDSLIALDLANNNLNDSAIIILQCVSMIISQLRLLNLEGNHMPKEAGEALGSVIANNSGIEILLLNKNNLGDGALHIARALKSKRSLKILDLGSNNLPGSVMNELGHIFMHNKYLEKLNLSNNNLKSSIFCVLRSLNTASKLEYLDIQDNQVTEEAGELIASVIQNNNSVLSTLLLGNNNIEKGMMQIVKALQQITSLKVLDLRNNNMPKVVCYDLALAINSNDHLEKLSLRGNKLHSSAITILQSLSNISSIEVLDLQECQLNATTGNFIASVVFSNKRLKYLYLQNNDIANGMERIVKALQEIRSLNLLDLGNNNIPKEVCKELSLAINSNDYLEKLRLQGNKLYSSAITILQSLSNISSIEVLDLQGCQLNATTGDFIASVILSNKRLKCLNLQNNNIANGIEHIAKALQKIKSLKLLDLGNNAIPKEVCKELSLAINSNVHLEKLWLQGNKLHASIIIILQSLSLLSDIRTLDMDNNQIGEIDGEVMVSIIKRNTGLKELHFASNNLQRCVVKIAQALQNISTLVSLDLSDNNLPEGIGIEIAVAIQSNNSLKQLKLHSNNLQSSIVVILEALSKLSTLELLDLHSSHLTAVAANGLHNVIMNNTRLKSLYVNNNSLGKGLITILKALKSISSLTELNISNNNFINDATANLRVANKVRIFLEIFCQCSYYSDSSELVFLKKLCIASKSHTMISIVEEAEKGLASTLQSNPRLNVLHVDSGCLSEVPKHFTKALKHVNFIKTLDLNNLKLSIETVSELASSIKSYNCLEEIFMHNSNLKLSVIILSEALTTISTLKVLDLQSNGLTEEAGESLASVIINNVALETLILDNNSIGVGVLKIAKALQNIKSLRLLGLSNNNLPKEVVHELSTAIKSNSYLEVLTLSSNDLRSSAIIILQMLSNITSLKGLDMSNNHIGDKGGQVLVAVIKSNINLIKLHLSSNNLKWSGIRISEALQSISSLESLDLSDNNLPEETGITLASAIQSNNFLKQIWFSGNDLQSSVGDILQALSKISTLEVIDLQNSQLTAKSGDWLKYLIMRNTTLQILLLDNNNIGVGAIKISEALRYTKTLKVLGLSNNNLPKEIAHHLQGVINSNCNIELLTLSSNNLHFSAIEILQSLSKTITLKVLYMNNNQIGERGGEALASIIMKNTGLKELHFASNNVHRSIIKISQMLQNISTLISLDLSDNNLPEGTGIEIAVAIQSNNSLKQLKLHSNNLQSSIVVILEALSKLSTLELLDLHSSHLTAVAANGLHNVIVNNARLKSLYVNNNSLGKGLITILKALKSISSLTELNISNNNFINDATANLRVANKVRIFLEIFCQCSYYSDSSELVFLKKLCIASKSHTMISIVEEAEKGLASTLQSNPRLNVLHVDSGCLSEVPKHFTKALKHVNFIKTLDLNNLKLSIETVSELASSIKSYNCLEEIFMHNSNLKLSVIILSEALTTISTLKVLDLKSNGLTEEAGESLASVIINNIALEKLILDNNSLGVGALKIAKALQNIKSLRLLGLSNNNLPKEIVHDLSIAINSSSYLEVLTLSSNDLQSSAIVILQSLCNITTLKILEMDNNHIGEEAGEVLVSVIKNNANLMKLHFSNNHLKRSGIRISEALQSISSLESLDLSDNNLPEETGIALASAIQSNNFLKQIWFSGNDLQSSVGDILQALSKISTLEVIDLQNSQLTAKSGDWLKYLIMRNTTLQILLLDNNNIGVGAIKISEALRYTKTLKVLGLSNNNLPKEIAHHLQGVINSNCNIELLTLSSNNLHSSAIEILQSLSKTITLKVLYMNNNQIGVKGGEALASVIMKNTGLKELYFASNNIHRSIIKISQMLQNISTLISLYLSDNNLPEGTGIEIAVAIQSNNSLKQLKLHSNNLQSSIVVILEALSKLSTLELLDLHSSHLTAVAANGLHNVIVNNARLKSLYVNNNSLGKGLITILKALKSISSLTELNISNNNFINDAIANLRVANKVRIFLEIFYHCSYYSDSSELVFLKKLCIASKSHTMISIVEEAEKGLASTLQSNPRLNVLHVDSGCLSEVPKHFTKALKHVNFIKTLDLNNLKLSIETVSELTSSIKSYNCLEKIFMHNSNLKLSVIILSEALTTISTLKVLDLKSNGLTEEAGESLASVIINNVALETLILDNNSLGVGALKIAKALQNIKSLRLLGLSNNNLPKEIVHELSTAIKSNSYLEVLTISSNDLRCSAIIILQALSNITSLKGLDISNNHIGDKSSEALASVVIDNTRVEKLLLSDNNLGDGILEVAKALQHITSLRLLDLGKNNMPKEVSGELALAIKSNGHLEKLSLNNNNLESSAIAILQALSTISTLKFLAINGNQITKEAGEALASVVINNTQIEVLHLSDNYLGDGIIEIAKALQHITSLRSLDLSNNNMPKEASGELALAIKSNEHLNELIGLHNNLKSSIIAILEALSTISTLKFLAINGNQITNDAGEALASVVIHNTGIIELFLSNNILGDGILEITKALQHITSLRSLDLSNNNIPKEVSGELALAVKSNGCLEKLNLNNNNLESSAIAILEALGTISTLKLLAINGNQITKEAGEALASVVINNTEIEVLHLSDNNLGNGILEVAKALQHITSLRSLDLGNNNIPKKVSGELALAIQSNKHLETLGLHNNKLESSAIAILQALSTISTLKGLDINGNQLSKDVGEALASVIIHNTGIEELILSNNNLGDGILEVAKALQHITSLRSLNLGDNNMPKEASGELALAIKSNEHLEKLCLYCTNLNSSAIVFFQALSSISSLEEINIDSCQFGDAGGEMLALVIKNNTRVKKLCSSNNNIQRSAIKVIESLQAITTLKSLNLGDTYLSKLVCIKLAAVIYSNNFLEKLILDRNNLRSSINHILQALHSVSKLTLLRVFNNSITEETGNLLASVISKNTELQELHVSLLRSPFNVIESLKNLSTLQSLVFCTCNISEEVEIKLAFVITNNKSLRYLSLPNVTLSQNLILQALTTISKLKTLWLEDNLLSEEMSDDLSSAISKNKQLEKLILLDNMLQTGLIKIAKTCNKLNNIHVVQLAHNCISPSKVVELTSIITQNTSLERVLVGGITLNAAEGFHYNINEVLHKRYYYNNTSLVSSNLSGFLEVIYLEMLRKQIDNDTKCLSSPHTHPNAKNFIFIQKLKNYFKQHDTAELKTQDTMVRLGQADVKRMISSLKLLKRVKVIDLENNNIDEDGSLELATALHSNNVLEQLWLRGNKLNTAGALYILNSLEYLTTLQVLDMSYNNIGSQSADGIAAVLDNNPLINQLWLDGNDLHSTGTITICNALKKVRRLSILSLCNNGISDDAADELSAVITQNVLLEDLLLSNNQLHSTGIKIIAESLSKLIKLRKLDLFNNNIDKEGASSLAIVIQNSTSLQDLFLSGNNLETSGALEICNALSHIKSLHVLTLSNNNISDEITSQLIEVLNNNHLYTLLIGGNGLECGGLKIAQVIENDNIAMQLLDYSNNNISEQDKEEIKVVFSKRANFKLYV